MFSNWPWPDMKKEPKIPTGNNIKDAFGAGKKIPLDKLPKNPGDDAHRNCMVKETGGRALASFVRMRKPCRIAYA